MGKITFFTNLNEIFHFKLLFFRQFPGFSGDDEFTAEAKKLKISLSEEKLKFNDKKRICISYDPPYKLFGRRNEILVLTA